MTFYVCKYAVTCTSLIVCENVVGFGMYTIIVFALPIISVLVILLEMVSSHTIYM